VSRPCENTGGETIHGDSRNHTAAFALGHRPLLHLDDVVATANFYRDRLGFRYERFCGEPPCFTMVGRNGITIMLKQPETPAGMHPNRLIDPEDSSWDAYIWVDDADPLYQQFQQNSVTIARPICDQAYGCRDFDIRDCNG
jgi:predicted enzyme related to lactoylglutathione lyase